VAVLFEAAAAAVRNDGGTHVYTCRRWPRTRRSRRWRTLSSPSSRPKRSSCSATDRLQSVANIWPV